MKEECLCKPRIYSKQQLNLINKMRSLWEQHDVWTRDIISSIVFELPNTNFITERLLQNPFDFAKALQPFYGIRKAIRFHDLLKEHLVLAAEIVTAAKNGDTIAAAEAERKWYINADEIAKFFGKINPFWSTKEWQKMMYKHLKLVKDEAVFLLLGNYKANVDVYDKIEIQTLMMADEISFGIIKQFCRR